MFKKVLLLICFSFFVNIYFANAEFEVINYKSKANTSPGNEFIGSIDLKINRTASTSIITAQPVSGNIVDWMERNLDLVLVSRSNNREMYQYKTLIPKTIVPRLSSGMIRIAEINKYGNEISSKQIFIEINITDPIKSMCIESDENADYFTKGYVELNGIKKEDECFGQFTLREYYCNNNTIQIANYICPNKCSNGACIIISNVEKNKNQDSNTTNKDLHEVTRTKSIPIENSHKLLIWALITLFIGVLITKYVFKVNKDSGGVSFLERMFGVVIFVIGVIMIIIDLKIMANSEAGSIIIFFIILFFGFLGSISKNKKQVTKKFSNTLLNIVNSKYN